MSPQLLVARLSQVGGGAALLVGLGLMATGRFMAAIPLLVVASSLLGWLPQPASWTRRTRRSAGKRSQVRAAMVEMVLDHDTGEMEGTVLAGPHAGQRLAALGEAELLDLLRIADADSRALLEAYLDRRIPGWREHRDADPAAGRGERRRDGAMTEQEAYEILGLEPGASAEDVRRAHRALMKRLHPDQGGSNWLAARVNQAKDVLLRHHR
jgi:DnaJ-domain-containing protein 1